MAHRVWAKEDALQGTVEKVGIKRLGKGVNEGIYLVQNSMRSMNGVPLSGEILRRPIVTREARL